MRRRRKVQRTNRDREVQMMAGRLVAVSHHRRVNRLVMAGTLIGQSSRRGVVRLVEAVAVEIVLDRAPVMIRARRLPMRAKNSSSLALSGEVGGMREPSATRRRSSNVLRCPS